MRRFRARIASLALLALAGWEIHVLWSEARAVPPDADWAAAAEAVRDGFADGDLVTFAPAWVDPVGRLWLGDLIGLAEAGRMDDVRYARIWEVSVRGARAPERADDEPVWQERFGSVTVRRFEFSAPVVTWDLRSAARLHEVDFEPRHCVPLILRAARRPLEFIVPRAQLADELHVRVGLTGVRERKANRSVGRLEVWLDDEVVTSGLVDEARGWSALPVAPTEAGPHRILFRASVDHVREPIDLRLCIAAEGRTAS